MTDGKWGEFEFEVDKKGYGYRMLDSISELEEQMKNIDGNIWVLADKKFRVYIGPKLISFVEQNFNKVYFNKQDGVNVYLWRKNLSPEKAS